MNRKRSIGFVLLGLGGVLVATGLVLYAQKSSEVERYRGSMAALEDSARAIRQQAVENNLRHKALELSIPQLPDSVRMYGGGELLEKSKEYSKRSHILEVKERDVRLEINGLARRADRAQSAAVSASVPAGVAGLVMLLAGLVVLRASHTRRVGA